MADEKRIATLEWLHNNLYEFKKTEELRNSKKGATKSELTRLYNVDESLLTSYTDKQLIPQGKCVGKYDTLRCNTMVEYSNSSGKKGVFETYFNLGKNSGVINILTSSFYTTKRFVVYSPSGEVLIDSKYYSETTSLTDSGDYSLKVFKHNIKTDEFEDSGEVEEVHVNEHDINTAKGISSRTFHFNKDESLEDYIVKLKVFALKETTAWDTKLGCPSDFLDLGVYGINHSCNVDFVNGKYQIVSSNSLYEPSTYYSYSPKEELTSSFLVSTDGMAYNSSFISSEQNLSKYEVYEELEGGNKKVKSFSGTTILLNEEFDWLKVTEDGDFTVSPNRRFVLENSSTKPCTLYDDVTTTNESFNYPIELGYVFDNKRVYTTLSYKQNYPEETFTNTTYCILSNQNSYLVLEQEGEKMRLSKISEDLTHIPTNVYSDFIKDCTENTNQLMVKFDYGHTGRSFTRDLDSFDFSDKEFRGLFSKQLIGGSEGDSTNTKIYIRFGENDLTHNYIEYETYIDNVSGGLYSDIWKEESFNGVDVISAINQRDSDEFSEEQRYIYPLSDPYKRIVVKGIIDITKLKKIMIGVRNMAGSSIRETLLWTKSPKIYKDGVKQFEIDISRKNVSVYNYNIYPHIISNEEGVELVFSEWSPDKDVLSEIMFKQEKIFEETIPSLKKATLITHRSNTDESFVRIELNNGTIQTRRTSNINNIINQGGDIVSSTIKSPTENLLIYKQPTSDVINITINGEERKMIGIVQNV